MKKILILGANGQIAKLVIKNLIDNKDFSLNLFLRHKSRLNDLVGDKATLIEGDTTKKEELVKAMDNVDLIYANLGDTGIVNQAKCVVEAMKEKSVKRLIWVSTLGIYNEVPGEYGKFNTEALSGGYLETYTEAAKIIENSDLDYTIIRPAWLDNYDEVDYEITHRHDKFKGSEVSRKSVADLITKIIEKPSLYIHDSLGVNKPNTDAPKPRWMMK